MKRALFRCDASPTLGAGHVMRCLTLADALAARGWTCAFASTSETAATTPALARSPFQNIVLAAPHDGAALAAAAGSGWDLIVFDHYGLGQAHETSCRPQTASLMAIDDLADRRHDVDLLLDQTFARTPDAYQGLVPDHALILSGSQFALLRPAFAAARPATLARRAAPGSARRVLVSLGYTDVGAITAAVAHALARVLGDAACDLVIGPAAPSRPALKALCAQDARFRLHIDPADIAALMTAADVALGAAGATSWERCCLGLPSVILTLADNQRLAAHRLQDAGAARMADDPAGAARMLASLMADQAARTDMAQAAAAVCDGAGAARVADAIEALPRRRRAA
jgi:UDP-2,4-diacetamido-2,4,6-trideoxy-beta-L-altropyranose hydrolase